MVNKETIEKIAELSRLKIKDGDKEKLSKDIESILGYIDVLNEVQVDENISGKFDLKNVMREDVDAHDQGEFSEKILDEAPKGKGNFVSVKNIL